MHLRAERDKKFGEKLKKKKLKPQGVIGKLLLCRSDLRWRRHHAAKPGGPYSLYHHFARTGFVQNLFRICALCLIYDFCKIWLGPVQNLIYAKPDLRFVQNRSFLPGSATTQWLSEHAWRDYRDPIIATLTMTTYIPDIKRKLSPHCAGVHSG